MKLNFLGPGSQARLFWLLVLSGIEGLAAVAWLLAARSELGSRGWLGISTPRLALAGLALLGVGGLAGLAWGVARRPAFEARLRARLDRWLLGAGHLLGTSAMLCLVAGLALAAFTLLFVPLDDAAWSFLSQFSKALPRTLEIVQAALGRAAGLALWAAALAVQGLVFLGLEYRAAYRQKWKEGALGRLVLAYAILAAASFEGLVIYFHLKVFLRIPGWKWYFYNKPDLAIQWAALPIGLVLAGVLAWLANRSDLDQRVTFRRGSLPRWVLYGLALVVVGAGLQICLGYFEGEGFESLRVKYAGSVFRGYAVAAAQEPGWLEPLREYEARYGSDWYLGTKPPGVLAVYIGLQKISNLIQPQSTDIDRFIRLTQFAAYTLPWLSFLVLLPLVALMRRLYGRASGELFPALLYVVCPNVLLIPLFLDQALYPLLFVGVLLLVEMTRERRSFVGALACGFLIYLCLYFSFSLLPLLPVAFLWLALDGFQRWRQRRQSLAELILTLRLLLILAAGVLLAYLACRWLLNYDVFLRYTHAMAQHRRAKEFTPGLDSALKYIYLNNAEIVLWTGFPVMLPFLVEAARLAWRWLKGLFVPDGSDPQPAQTLLVAFMASYLALNLFGQTNGEVQRLWLFQVPLFALFAAPLAKKLLRSPGASIAFLALLQWAMTFLLFKFQDFYG